MNYLKYLLVAGLLLAPSARAYCPVSVACSIDGMTMLQEGCYYNGPHETCKFGHDYYGPNGKEHHYVMVDCD